MNDWFKIDLLDEESFIISEYRHWEETHCYLLNGSKQSLLIDTGLGICNIHDELNWLNGEFPLTTEQIKDMVVDRCDLPEGRYLQA